MAAFKRYRGTIDFQQGTVTDQETGQIFTFDDWLLFVDDARRDELRTMLESRDLRAFDQNLPGEKPWFGDDWMGIFPARPDRRNEYSYDLGFRSPYVSPYPLPED